MPIERGATSNSSKSSTSPANIPPWIAAPRATASSGFTERSGSLPPKNNLMAFCTAGIRVEPPTRIILSMSSGLRSASRRDSFTGRIVPSIKSLANSSNFDLLISISRCLGPVSSAVMKGRLREVVRVLDSSIFAFSAASRSLWSAILSCPKSMASSAWNLSIIQRTITLSKSSPPKWLFPEVAFTSNTPSPSWRTETSKVPPPRSNTKTVWS